MRIVYTKQSKCHKFYNSLTFPSGPEPNFPPQMFCVCVFARVSVFAPSCGVLCHWLRKHRDNKLTRPTMAAAKVWPSIYIHKIYTHTHNRTHFVSAPFNALH